MDDGNPAVVVRAFYGLKSSGASFWKYLANCMKHSEYIACPVDPYLWMNPMVISSDGDEYYAYILLYVDDIFGIHHYAESALTKVDMYF